MWLLIDMAAYSSAEEVDIKEIITQRNGIVRLLSGIEERDAGGDRMGIWDRSLRFGLSHHLISS